MKNAPRIINFECDVACGGKCCYGAANITYKEVPFFVDKVPIIPSFSVLGAGDLPKRDKAYNARIKKAGVKIDVDTLGAGRTYYILMDFYFGSLASRNACIFLQDGLCSIYDDRPLKCRLLPAQPLVPESVGYAGAEWLRPMCPGVLSPGRTDKVFWKNGAFADRSVRTMTAEYLAALADHKKLAELLIGFERQYSASLGEPSIVDRLVHNRLNAVEGETTQIVVDCSMAPFDEHTELFGMSGEEFARAQMKAFERYRAYDPQGYEASPTLRLQDHIIQAWLLELERTK